MDVDHDGIDVEAGIRAAPHARLAYVTPSHQCPLGSRLSLGSGVSLLLGWAAPVGAWIIEDDYDSEYRYTGRPLASSACVGRGRRVLYVGSFSLMLFPSLRIGFIVAPPALVDVFLSARTLADWSSSAIDQAVLAQFIDRGLLVRHLRRMRVLYAERQRTLLMAAARMLGPWMRVGKATVGTSCGGMADGRYRRSR